MIFSERLKKLRIEQGYTQETIAKKLKISKQAYRKYEQGIGFPRPETLKMICVLLDTSEEFLNNTEILPFYQKLNKHRQEETISFAKKQLDDQQKENNIIIFNNSLFGYPVLSDQALSAGKGNGISDDMSTYTAYWTKEVNCDYGVPIKGDSMEPDYHDKDIALIQEQPCPDYDGQVCAVIDFDRGVSYIKCVTVEDKFLRLESLNQVVDDEGNLLYDDILLPRDETIKILGKVIESFTPVDKKEF